MVWGVYGVETLDALKCYVPWFAIVVVVLSCSAPECT